MLKQLKPVFPNNGLHLKDSGLMPPLTESTEAWLEQDLKEMSKIKKIRGKTHHHTQLRRMSTPDIIRSQWYGHFSSDTWIVTLIKVSSSPHPVS